MREKPNAAKVALEGMILFSNNRTASWLAAKTAAERDLILSLARKSAVDLRSQYKLRHTAILQYRAAELQKKEEDLRRKRERELQRKEELTADNEKYGLWRTEELVKENLAKLTAVRDKRAALRAQLLFRKFVLKQEGRKELFQLSKDGHLLSIEQLASNLVSLLVSP